MTDRDCGCGQHHTPPPAGEPFIPAAVDGGPPQDPDNDGNNPTPEPPSREWLEDVRGIPPNADLEASRLMALPLDLFVGKCECEALCECGAP